MNPFNDIISKAITEAFKELLSTRHLYQVIRPNLEGIPASAESMRKIFRKPLSSTLPALGPLMPSAEEMVTMGMALANQSWLPSEAVFAPAPSVSKDGQEFVQFQVPSINTFCDHCQNAWPFNPTYDTVCLGEGKHQWYLLGYQCQQCKGRPIRFLIRRDDLKLRMVGRDPLEVLPVPQSIPKTVAKYYSDALVAHHAGQTLAGLFLLRTCIEQYWRTVDAVKQFIAKQPRATGDEQGSIYQQTLPNDFKDRFPSLSDIYAKLSAAMHEAKADTQLFDDACKKTVKHFDARRLYEL